MIGGYVQWRTKEKGKLRRKVPNSRNSKFKGSEGLGKIGEQNARKKQGVEN